uniref:Putative secreted protein n=1 Tax=Anopheles marajoara TaxID=58244 RepID=A0A2M4CF12_9DIPT
MSACRLCSSITCWQWVCSLPRVPFFRLNACTKHTYTRPRARAPVSIILSFHPARPKLRDNFVIRFCTVR